MNVSVKSRAHRALRRLKQYLQFPGEIEEALLELGGAKLGEGEVVLGIYKNFHDSFNLCVLITDKGIHINNKSEWSIIYYEDLVNAQLYGDETLNTYKGVEIRTRNEFPILLPVLGEDSMIGTNDSYAFNMFLQHVIGDYSRQK